MRMLSRASFSCRFVYMALIWHLSEALTHLVGMGMSYVCLLEHLKINVRGYFVFRSVAVS